MATNHRLCFERKSNFCYVCSDYVKKADRRTLTGVLLTYLILCYPYDRIDTRHSYTPSTICSRCRINVSSIGKCLKNKEKPTLKLGIIELARWKRPNDDHENCFLCKVDLTFSSNNPRHPDRFNRYKDLSLELPVYRTNEDDEVDFTAEEYDQINDYADVEFDDLDEDYVPTTSSSGATAEIKVLTQNEINDMVKVLQLDKQKSELFASMFKRLFKFYDSVKLKIQLHVLPEAN